MPFYFYSEAMESWTFAGKQFACPIALTASLFESKWRTNVLWLIWSGTNRFPDLLRQLPEVNRGVLMRVLRELQEDGLIEPSQEDRDPLAYVLTDLGTTLGPVMAQMAQWGRLHCDSSETV